MGAGLQRVLKSFGRMNVSDGKRTIHYVWDYARDEPTTAEDMPEGSERWLASEKAKYQAIVDSIRLRLSEE